jgi:predicted CoA-binding protein
MEVPILEARILSKYRSIAVVGASANPERPSYQIASYLIGEGYQVHPVNPNAREILGRPSYPSLSSIPEKVEVVNIFRRSEDVMPIVDEAIKIGARVVWMQTGVINEKAAAKARDAGLLVIMNKCILEEHQHLSDKVN